MSAFETSYKWLFAQRLAVVAVIASVVIANILAIRFDTRMGDVLLTELASHSTESSDIVIVAIDESTLATLPYRSPIDRGLLAEIIKSIDAAQPKAVGIDILIDRPSETEKDRRFLDAVQQMKAPVVLAFATRLNGLTEAQYTFLDQTLEGTEKGDVTLGRDRFDGLVRQWPERTNRESASAKLFSEALARHAGAETPRVDGRIVYNLSPSPTQPPFPLYIAHHVKLLPKAWFKDKIVLIGATLPGIDQYPTPLTTRFGVDVGTIHGVVIHAHMISQLLRGVTIATLSIPANVILSVVFALAAAMITLARRPLLYRLAGVGCLILAGVALSIGAFRFAHLEPGLVAMTLSAILTSAILAAREWYRDQAERQFIQQAFAHYLSPAVVDKIAADPKLLALGGETRRVTYVFTDLEGFTGLSEELDAQGVSALLNDYLDGVCNLFISHHATIDKIVGDAVIGFFGAPEEQPRQEQLAVELALAIDAFCEGYRARSHKQGIALGCTRIGVHTGPAIVGNFGGRRFFDYTGIGDTVNTAARMEAANRHFGTRICVSATTASACEKIEFLPIGDIVFKGKTEAITCYEARGQGGAGDGLSEKYRKAIDDLRRGDDSAKKALEELADQCPEDALVNYHLARLQRGEFGAKIVLDEK